MQAGTEPAEVLVLGTFHFHNPGLDAVQFEVPDPLGEKRQAEIAAVVDALADFRPTRVAVEHVPDDEDKLIQRYQNWQADERALGPSETEQLGFRLADRFGHERVWPFDHSATLPFEPLMEYAQSNDPEFVRWFEGSIERRSQEMDRKQQEWSLSRILVHLNCEDVLVDDHAFYLHIARVGAGTTQVGADLLSAWYERNIRMFGNLQAATQPGDRVIVIVGAGHAPILRELIKADAAMTLVEPVEFLPKE
ncbi:hypothetical protein IC757_08180 [Wenzhouxiangella sp. AB-CW3]|uniref:DUF5694 domain-containing protein n=1 Tax=Wenzhouxiangella sp. AB-CW3 TaxID=2771012 RepID=UPI00168BEF15|nr:DUF5694 domain-containing protein [Wenzhouxiangella sp. AB-CW3]QOC24066.1 hypothetical protein IC757_08180 [Wenzhouxiangella sp. AB-CW3]